LGESLIVLESAAMLGTTLVAVLIFHRMLLLPGTFPYYLLSTSIVITTILTGVLSFVIAAITPLQGDYIRSAAYFLLMMFHTVLLLRALKDDNWFTRTGKKIKKVSHGQYLLPRNRHNQALPSFE